jgi:hypothetical protein
MENNHLLIKILLKLRPFLKKLIKDFDQFIIILSLKLTLDNRKTSLQEASGNRSKLGAMQQNLLMMAIIGLFIGLMLISPFDLFYKVVILSGVNVFFLVMYMVSDFSTVLLDLRDSTVIMTKPVTSKTLNMARIVHISYYMLSMFLALNLFSFIIGTANHGFKFFLAMLVMMIFLSLLVIVMTTLLYSLLLKLFSGEKLKDILNIFQIFISIVTVIAYQVLGRIFSIVDLELTIQMKWWSYLLAPTWYGGLFKVLVEGDLSRVNLQLSALAIVVPLLLVFIMILWVFPKYESYLMKLSVESGLKVKRKGLFFRIRAGVMTLFSRDHTENAFIRFSHANMSRDRKLKLMIYPNHALGMIFPFIIFFSSFAREGIIESIQNLQGSFSYLILYLPLAFLTQNFDFIQFSSDAKSSSIYDSFPVDNKNIIYRGALKAYYLKFVLPFMAILTLIFAPLYGPSSWLGLVFINVSALIMMYIRGWITGMFLPFSKEIGGKFKRDVGTSILMMLLVGLMAGLHALIFYLPWFVGLISIVVFIFITKVLSKKTLKLTKWT